MTNNSLSLDQEDDLLAYERSTFREFIDDSQASVLLILWAVHEKRDNDAFMREFVWGEDD